MGLFARSTAVMRLWLACLVACLTNGMKAQSFPPQPPVVATQTPHGFDATIGPETLHVTVCSDVILHIVTRPHGGDTSHPQPWLLPPAQSCPGAAFTFAQDAQQATLTTARLKVALMLDHGNLIFSTPDGHTLLREYPLVPRTYAPVALNGEATFHVVDRFSPNPTEAIYGLGQHQSGVFNYRGSVIELGQQNTDIAIPFLSSTNGYGILWNTAAFSTFDNRFPQQFLFDSIAGDGVDYFFLYGPEMDSLIHQYRNITGHAPMLPRWAFGYIQSKDRYKSLDEIEAIAARYRAEHIPMDVMVQDWFWWKRRGDPVFNDNYHDVPAALAKLHDEHVHTLISTWALLDTDSDTYKKMDAENLLVPRAHIYDASNPRARDEYWKSLIGPLFAQGWDSFWLDSAEPEEYYPHSGDAILRDKTLAIGNGALYTNVYPLLHNEGVQQHWRETTDQKRVFLLTRSAFMGQQRVGATEWSGDVYSSFWALSHQVPAGLNFALSGMPFWTTDIGGYVPLSPDQSTTPEYQELYLRWFQFGVFCPIFRSHGHRPNNEIWSYPAVEPSLIYFDKLRYRLMPYIYSLAARVDSADYTMQRPLVMDFRADSATWDIPDQFMFGPAIMVSPVTTPGTTQRAVYLPQGAAWYDFWTGQKLPGGQHLQAAAPLDRLPLYVRAGSILPLGPEEDYTSEKPNGPIELRIYPGADASFTLYQDASDTYAYEKGQFTTTTLHWTDATHTLSIGPREGEYPNMPTSTEFRITLVGPDHAVGESESTPANTLTYTGPRQILKVR